MADLEEVSVLWTCPPQKLRKLVENKEFRCKLCKRHLNSDDMHWVCVFCRVNSPCGKCPLNCDACFMMSVPKVPTNDKKTPKQSVKRDKRYKKRSYKTRKLDAKKVVVSKNPSYVIKRPNAHEKAMSILAKESIVSEDISSLERVKQMQIYEKMPQTRMNQVLSDTKKCKNDEHFYKRIKELEPLLFGELDPTIPEYLLSPDLKLPPVPGPLIDQYMAIKDELVRLLATSSICCHLSDKLSKQEEESEQVDDINSDGFENMFMGVIMWKANDFADIIFEIRKALLLKVTCKDSNIIPLLIRGAIEPSLSFFGNIRRLMAAVERDSNNVLIKKK